MIIVTGGAGFIGSNLIRRLNAVGRSDILVVDNLADGRKFANLADCAILDYFDQDEFLDHVQWGTEVPDTVEVMFHLGACSATTEWDGRFMMRNNYAYSRAVFRYCLDRRIPFIYASSAAVYGLGQVFREDPGCEHPLNVYGYSKLLFDHYVRRFLPDAASQIVGLRFFNVYGPREAHKGAMASVAWQFHRQAASDGRIRLYQGSGGFSDGEQRRDFVFIEDAIDVAEWFARHPEKSGIFNVGTGRAQTFNDLARAVIAWHGRGAIDYIPFPDGLSGSYQHYTQADLEALRAAGYAGSFRSVEEGVPNYLDWLDPHSRRSA